MREGGVKGRESRWGPVLPERSSISSGSAGIAGAQDADAPGEIKEYTPPENRRTGRMELKKEKKAFCRFSFPIPVWSIPQAEHQ